MNISDSKYATKPAAHRSAVAAADTGNISSSTGVMPVADGLHIHAIAEFSNASATAAIALALFSRDKDLIGITDAKTFTADASWRDGGSGPYVSPCKAFDLMGASFVRAIVKSLSAGTVTIYLGELRLV